MSAGNGIKMVQMLALKMMLELEINGLKRIGRTAYSIIKERYELTGYKRSVYSQFCKIVDQESKKFNPDDVQHLSTRLSRSELISDQILPDVITWYLPVPRPYNGDSSS